MPKFHRRRSRRRFEPASPPATPELRVIEGGRLHQVDELRPALAATSWRPFTGEASQVLPPRATGEASEGRSPP